MKRGKTRSYQQNAALFLGIRTHKELSNLLRISLSWLEILINKPTYKEYAIRKKRHGVRTIHEPTPYLKAVLKQLSFYLNAVYSTLPNNSAYGFIPHIDKTNPQKNIRENAIKHVGKNHLFSLDLKDFFHTISAKRVYQIFQEEPFNFQESLAIPLALLTTYRKSLPMGANTSPILSNFACLDLDADLSRLASGSDLEYTRYADDLTFSSDLPFTAHLKSDIRKTILSHGFQINDKKLRERSKNRRQVVTGIKVNTKLNLDRKYIRNLRALLFDWRTNGLRKAVMNHFDLERAPTYQQVDYFLSSTRGKISFVGFVRGKEDPIYLKLQGEFEGLVAEIREMV